MPNEVIDCVHDLARRSIATLTFADRGGSIIPNNDDNDDAEDDGDYEPDGGDPPDSDDGETGGSDNDDHDDAADAPNLDAELLDPDLDIAGVYGNNNDGKTTQTQITSTNRQSSNPSSP